MYQLLSLGAEERVDSDDERCRGAEDFQELPGQDGDIREAEEEKKKERKKRTVRCFEDASNGAFH